MQAALFSRLIWARDQGQRPVSSARYSSTVASETSTDSLATQRGFTAFELLHDEVGCLSRPPPGQRPPSRAWRGASIRRGPGTSRPPPVPAWTSRAGPGPGGPPRPSGPRSPPRSGRRPVHAPPRALPAVQVSRAISGISPPVSASGAPCPGAEPGPASPARPPPPRPSPGLQFLLPLGLPGRRLRCLAGRSEPGPLRVVVPLRVRLDPAERLSRRPPCSRRAAQRPGRWCDPWPSPRRPPRPAQPLAAGCSRTAASLSAGLPSGASSCSSGSEEEPRRN